MTASPTLILGTANRKKGLELAGLMRGADLRVLTLADVPDPLSVDESGQSFAENARLKAVNQARHLRQWVLADDSGLMVDALNGGPGIRSARYAGPQATDADNRRRLLTEMADVSADRRSARFVCHLTLADPMGEIRAETTACCCGRILFEERGLGGFGYDPLFEIAEYHLTFGQLGPTAKSHLSHRARAVEKLLPEIARLIASGQWGQPVGPTPELANALWRDKVLAARAMSPEEQLLAGPRLFERACRIMEDGIRAEHPEADEQRVKEILLKRLALARRLENSP